MSELALVIPSVGHRPHCIGLLDRLLNSIVVGGIDTEAEIVVCLDACPQEFIEFFQEKYPNYTYLIHKGNRQNFCANSNMGLRYAFGADKSAILCNMDTVLPEADELLLLSTRHGLCSASSTQEPEIHKLNALNHERDLVFTSVMDVPGNKFAGYCYYIDRKVMEKIGYLPESFKASMDDDMYIAKALLAGFRVEISNVFVYHEGTHVDQAALGGSMTGSYNGELLNINFHKFRSIWQIPPEIPHEKFIDYILKNFEWQDEMYEV